jgi:hypothetical protein
VVDLLGIGSTANVMRYKDEIKNWMECEDVGLLNEYIRCKVNQDVDGWSVKLTQPVLIRSFQDEFELRDFKFTIPVPPGEELASGDHSDPLPQTGQTKYQSGV